MVCKERDFVPEMVFLLGRMGNNKQALTLIIERLGDVNRVSMFLVPPLVKLTQLFCKGNRFREGTE